MEIVMGIRGMGFVVAVRRWGEYGNCNGVYGNGIFVACKTFRENEILMGFKEMGFVVNVRRYSENEICNEL
jgi:hypothetical protein